MPQMEIARSIALDDETAIRLYAACQFLLREEKKNIPPELIVRDAVNKLHLSVSQSRPAYAMFFAATKSAAMKMFHGDEDDDDDKSPLPPLLTEFPTEFMKLTTGPESIFLKRKFRCQFCETPFTAPSLKTGSLMTKFDPHTQLEIYIGTRQDSNKEFADFALFNVVVCPACLYAATEKDFDTWSTNARGEAEWVRRNRAKHSDKNKKSFRLQLTKRAEIAHRAGRNGQMLFSARRTERDAEIALDLAVEALKFMRPHVNQAQQAGLLNDIGVLALMKQLMLEKQIDNPDNEANVGELKKRRVEAVRQALQAFNSVPEQSAENFEPRELARYHSRRFWAAKEIRDVQAFAASGAALQRIYNQYENLVKKFERDVQTQEDNAKKIRAEIAKTGNVQKKEAMEKQAKEIDGNVSMIRNGLENARGVQKVIVPIYDDISFEYDKFKEMQRQRAAQQAASA
ncbi:MAG: DUF2225 domain-containing protein [Planctomycetota bacterium]|jgi:hypothetical protein|nr:DUF2225 domain-containing protein [Planctomycetota bacterium]